MDDFYKKMSEKFPFLSYGTYLENEYVGIVQNADNQFISIYVFNNLPSEEMKKRFLQLGDVWWWESNRMIPINIFLKEQFKMFKPYLKTFVRKEFNLVYGPIVSLNDVSTKRVKRRQIQLVRKI